MRFEKVCQAGVLLTEAYFCNNMVITMQVQTVFRAGNSNVVTIPSDLMQELNISVGEKVTVGKTPVGEGLLIKKTNMKNKHKDEMNQWFKIFIKENKEMLDDLAVR